MMNASECRAKAKAALDRMERTTDPLVKSVYAGLAREWMGLAVTADVQEKLEFDLLGRHADQDDAEGPSA